jgi:hypothetical protein
MSVPVKSQQIHYPIELYAFTVKIATNGSIGTEDLYFRLKLDSVKVDAFIRNSNSSIGQFRFIAQYEF